jgi:hypothetical protein
MDEAHRTSNTTRNVIIAVLAAALILGAGYLFFMNKNTDNAAQTQVPVATATAAPSPTPEAITMEVPLSAQSTSGEDGTATLTETDGKTTVVITVANPPANTPQPAHIHKGACPKPGEVVYPLTNVVNGTSETVIDTTIQELIAQKPLAVNVHKSATQSAVYVACGDLQ